MASADLHAGSADRLGSTLFVAALAHGVVILGITFTAEPQPLRDAPPTLNVTLLLEAPDSGPSPTPQDLTAERDQLGAGPSTHDRRPTRAPEATTSRAQAGDPSAADVVDGAPLERSLALPQLVTSAPSQARSATVPDTTETPAAMASHAAVQVDTAAHRTLAAELDLTAAQPDTDTPADVARPSTSASVVAAYLVGWRQRIERIGTANFPARLLATGETIGRPTLEVAIAPDGSLADIIVRRSSGDSSLDQAALEILRMAEPFEPLPREVRAEYDELRFAYEWDFDAGRHRLGPEGSPAPQ